MYGSLCAEFYDLSLSSPYADNKEIYFYNSYLKPTCTYLEAMCGSGRLLIPLLKNGLQVHGVDNSSSMLQSCKDRAKAFNLDPILFNDYAEKMALPYLYDGILISLGSFQLLPTRSTALQALENFRKHLDYGGKIILDLFIPWKALHEGGEEYFYSEKEVTTQNGEVIKLKMCEKANKFNQSVLTSSTYCKILNGKIIKNEEEKYCLRWYYQFEVELMLEKVGFTNIKMIEREINQVQLMTFIAEKDN